LVTKTASAATTKTNIKESIIETIIEILGHLRLCSVNDAFFKVLTI